MTVPLEGESWSASEQGCTLYDGGQWANRPVQVIRNGLAHSGNFRLTMCERKQPAVDIQPASPDTIPFVIAYCHSCGGGDGGGLTYEELLRRYLCRLRSGRYWCFIAAFSGQPVGYVDLELRSQEGQDALWICELYVVPERRRQGIGTALLKRAVAFARRGGWNTAYGTTEPDNPGGLAVLRKAGFKIMRAGEDQFLLRVAVQ